MVLTLLESYFGTKIIYLHESGSFQLHGLDTHIKLNTLKENLTQETKMFKAFSASGVAGSKYFNDNNRILIPSSGSNRN